MRHAIDTFDVLRNRFLHILVSIVLIYALIVVFERLFYRFAKPTMFVSKVDMLVSSTVEGTDIPARICREAKGRYDGTAVRRVYRVPEDSGVEGRVLVKSVEIKRIVVVSGCENALLLNKDYGLGPGKYLFTTDSRFKVRHGEEKHLVYDSNVFSILPTTPKDIQKRIRELEREIMRLRELRDQLERQVGSTGGVNPASTTGITPKRLQSPQK